jgi:Flp pilus assembly protein TadG
MTSIRNTACILSRLSDLRSDHRGVAAVEFAIILPFMAALYIGGVELGDGLAIQVKVTDTAHTVTDLISQQSATTDIATVNGILNASSAIIAPYASPPYSASNLIVTVSEVTTDSSGNPTVTWSESLNGTPRTAGKPLSIALPSSLAGQANISLILGEVSYKYTPNLGGAITGTVVISDSYYLFPRNSASIACSTCT